MDKQKETYKMEELDCASTLLLLRNTENGFEGADELFQADKQCDKDNSIDGLDPSLEMERYKVESSSSGSPNYESESLSSQNSPPYLGIEPQPSHQDTGYWGNTSPSTESSISPIKMEDMNDQSLYQPIHEENKDDEHEMSSFDDYESDSSWESVSECDSGNSTDNSEENSVVPPAIRRWTEGEPLSVGLPDLVAAEFDKLCIESAYMKDRYIQSIADELNDSSSNEYHANKSRLHAVHDEDDNILGRYRNNEASRGSRQKRKLDNNTALASLDFDRYEAAVNSLQEQWLKDVVGQLEDEYVAQGFDLGALQEMRNQVGLK